MRQGQNPAKFVNKVSNPENLTVAVLAYIPFLSGYYEQSFELLKICLWSILEHTEQPYDLMVFDNGSCREVIQYLIDASDAGRIQYLLLSSKNLGKVGAWNMILSGAPGEFIVYADSDIFFFPNWLPAHFKLINHFPDVGTVTGLPRRRRTTFSERTIERVQDNPEIEMHRGHFIPEQWIIDHSRSVGKLDTVDSDLKRDDILLTYEGAQAYVTAQHFQFMIRKRDIKPHLPFSYDRPMGKDVANFDLALEASGLLRIATTERTILHMGNRIDPELVGQFNLGAIIRERKVRVKSSRSPALGRVLDWSPVRYVLLGIYNRIFRIFFSS